MILFIIWIKTGRIRKICLVLKKEKVFKEGKVSYSGFYCGPGNVSFSPCAPQRKKIVLNVSPLQGTSLNRNVALTTMSRGAPM